MHAPHFVQVNKRQTQTHIGFKIFVKSHSDFYNPFIYGIYENEIEIWREIKNMMDYEFKKTLDPL